MIKNVTKLIIFLILLAIFTPIQQTFAYADLSNYESYIDNLDISYKDLSLTPEELEAIKQLQENGGITYGMHDNDNTIYMIFKQISKVFDIETTPIVYDDYAMLLNDVSEGKVDFTGSMIPTKERLELFDFTTSTHKDKTFLFITHSDFDLINSSARNVDRVIKVGYPTGFALDGLLTDDFKETFNYELIPIASDDEAFVLIKEGKLDMVFGDITWYGKLVTIENYMAIDYYNYIDTYFSGNLTKKGTNPELISAINKMYAETNALVELQNQIDNYYQDAALYALRAKYYDTVNHEKVNKIYVSEYRPYVYKLNDEYTGLFIDLISEIFNAFNIKYEFVSSNTDTTENLINDGITVFMPVFVTDEAEEKYTITIPIAQSNMVVITKPDNSTKYFTNVEDLEIQKVGALDTNYIHDYIDEIFINCEKISYYEDLDALVGAINSGEIKFGIVPYEEFNKYVIENKITYIDVLSSLHLPQYSIAFGTPKTERGLQYETIISSILSILNYSDLENKYLSTTPEIEAVYQYRNEMLTSTIHMVIFSGLLAISVLCSLIYINQKRANTDYLTKLRNRRTHEDYIDFAKRHKNTSVAYIDLDNFKLINDVYGHHYGDKVLIYVADELTKLSKHSRSFRVGGDEFIIVYNNKHINFDDIKQILDKTIKVEQTDIKVEGSVGNLSLEQYSYLDVEDIINLVDYAMISAKRRGKNIVVEIDDDLVNNFITIRDLRAALENEQYEDTVKLYMESIKDNNQIHGLCLVAKCHYNDHFISYDEIRVHMTNRLVLNKIGFIIFEKLCQSINYINGISKVKMSYIYELETESVTKQNLEVLGFLLEKHNIKPNDITLRVDPLLFSGLKGVEYLKLINNLGCKVSIDFYKITGGALLYINYLDFSTIEVDLSGLIEILENIDLSNTTQIFKELSNNLAVQQLIQFTNSFKNDLLLYSNDAEFLKIAINYLSDKIDTKISYIEKDKLTLLDDYLASIK